MDKLYLVGAQRKALENSAGGYTYAFFLAALSDLFDETEDPDLFPLSESRGYDTFLNYISEEPRKATRALTIMAGAKTMLAVLFADMVHAVDVTGKLPGGKVKSHFLGLQDPAARGVQIMINVAEALADKIDAGLLKRELNSVASFQTKIVCHVKNKQDVDPGSEELARIYVRFLKCIAWVTAQCACEIKVTLNDKFMRAVFRLFSGYKNVEVGDDFLFWINSQLDWVAVNDSSYKSKKPVALAVKKTVSRPSPAKPAVSKTAVAPTTAPATVSAMAPATVSAKAPPPGAAKKTVAGATAPATAPATATVSAPATVSAKAPPPGAAKKTVAGATAPATVTVSAPATAPATVSAKAPPPGAAKKTVAGATAPATASAPATATVSAPATATTTVSKAPPPGAAKKTVVAPATASAPATATVSAPATATGLTTTASTTTATVSTSAPQAVADALDDIYSDDD